MSSELPDPAWSSTVVLGDGDTALIRPIQPADAPALAAFHERQSAESRYRRYFSPKPYLDDKLLERFTNVDMVDRAAFVVELHGEFIAWASYERWQQREDAEVAFQVDDLDGQTATGWSVLVQGTTGPWAGEVPVLSPWAPGRREVAVAIEPTSWSGRSVSADEGV